MPAFAAGSCCVGGWGWVMSSRHLGASLTRILYVNAVQWRCRFGLVASFILYVEELLEPQALQNCDSSLVSCETDLLLLSKGLLQSY
uniref:Uncharacterized protein n=1 Tax=Physcomitrium patens TaxID=3218 RepID=A0A2K1J225_PHYPA|nr:hypothetical protein PHYPA_023467 [Physcomitrium patens]